MKKLTSFSNKNKAIPIINPNIVFRLEDDGYGFAFNIATEHLMTFNSTATEIWNLIDGRRDIENIVLSMANEYEVGPSELSDSIINFFNSLYKNECIFIKSGNNE
jgi:hypothetical protein